MNVFKDKVNLEDFCSLETDKIDRFLDDVENAKDNINSCVSKATNVIISRSLKLQILLYLVPVYP